jgi:hypothetical protein
MENHKRADGTLKEYYVWRLTAPKTKILSDEEAIIRILEN